MAMILARLKRLSRVCKPSVVQSRSSVFPFLAVTD